MPRNQLTKNRTRLLLAQLGIGALCCSPVSSAHAALTQWNTNASGVFTNPFNWTSGVPDDNDIALFNSGFVAYEVVFPAGSIFDPPPIFSIYDLIVATNEVSFVYPPFSLNPPSLSVLDPNLSIVIGESSGDVSILNTAIGRLSGANASIGSLAGANGTLNVGGTFSMSGSLHVGDAGTGTLNVTGGGRVESFDASLGRSVGSVGHAIISGAGSQWIYSDDLRVGNGGTGTLTVEAGGRVSDDNGFVSYIAYEPGSTGTVTITGAGTTWTISRALRVGHGGRGTLSITAGGAVSSGGTWIGPGEVDASGNVNVDGIGSMLSNRGTLFVDATLDIQNGGAVSNTSGRIGDAPGSSGTVTVTGAGSTWTNGELYLGGRGEGALTIEASGSVSSGNGYLGTEFGSTGSATVTGAGSTWTNQYDLYIGGFGTETGELTIEAGGTVSVGEDVYVRPNGLVRLQGGTLDAHSISGGHFQFTSGTLHVGVYDGNLTNSGGTLAPGHSAGSTTINGNYTQQAGAALQLEIGGASAGGTHDTVSVTGNASLLGQLQLAMLNGFVPSPADTFTVFNAGGGLLGAFANVATGQRLPTTDGLGSFVVNYGPASAFNQNQIVLSAFQPALSADFDEDGAVDADDLAQWQGDFGLNGDSDADNDGDSDGADFLTWQRQLGSSPAVVPAADAVPEPATFVLLIVATAGWCQRRRRTV